MAAPDVAVPQANGLPGASHPDSPQSINSPTKRKRDVSDEGSPEPNGVNESTSVTAHNHKPRDEGPIVQSYFEVLRRCDPVESKNPLFERLHRA